MMQVVWFHAKAKEQTEYYHYDLTLDVYNSSSETKILRNIKIEFDDGKNILHKVSLKMIPHGVGMAQSAFMTALLR